MMDEHHRDSDLDDSLSHNDLSDADPDLGDADSVDGDSHHISLQKIQDEDRVDRHSLPDAHRLSAASMVPPPPFSLPMPYPFSHPAYLPPSNAFPPNPPVHRTSSEGSHSSESSSSSQQTWSYEEQYKQLYELSDEPKRKEFLDDLFSFNQKKGTPINRLPIMAKSVLDLYELYNHVVQRGGLVEVINKKLWQEIIKGLNLPSSITSAAFTLRTQYMKYLYPYECHKLNLSSNSELQAAIDGNRRDQRDRRVSCSVSYSQLHGAGGVPTSSFGLTSPLRSVSSSSPHSRNHLNGGFHHSANNNNNTINPYLSPALAGMIPGLHPGLTSAELETRMAEYLHILNKQLRLQPAVSPPDDRPGSHATSPVGGSTGDSTPGPDLPSRLALWNNLYHSPPPHAPPTSLPPQSPLVNLPPQREALNLGKRESDGSPPAPPAKRPHSEKKANGGAVIKQEPAETRVEPNNNKMGGLSVNAGARENSIVVSIDIGGIQYQGVLFAQSLADKGQHAPVSMST